MTSEPKQITPNLWVTQSQFAETNSGVFISGDKACYIDLGILPEEINMQTMQHKKTV